jgi:hypothetical protein
MSRRKRVPLPTSVSIEIARKIYHGFYYVEQGAVMVAFGSRRKASPIGRFDPPLLARVLLLELVEAELCVSAVDSQCTQ